MKKAVVFVCVALLGAGAAFGGMLSEDPGELTVSGQAFWPDHADCDLFEAGYGALVSYREWFSFPWGVGLDLGVSWRTPWQGELIFGAQNVLNKTPDTSQWPLPDLPAIEAPGGRIPYVRYKQDL